MLCHFDTFSKGFVHEAELPYYEYVGQDPGFEDMRKIVCLEKLRPTIPAAWGHQEVCYYLLGTSFYIEPVAEKMYNLVTYLAEN